MTIVHAGDATTDCAQCVRIGAGECAVSGHVLIAADGGVLCAQCVQENAELIAAVNREHDNDQWQIVGSQPYDDGDACEHCYAELVTP